MKLLNPYLTFNGNCREALSFYQSVLGGTTTFMTVEESPIAEYMPPDTAKHIMHGQVTLDIGVVMGTDCSPVKHASSIAIDCSSPDEQASLFEKLSEGGSVGAPISGAFWGGTFGMVTDRFGVNWLLTCA